MGNWDRLQGDSEPELKAAQAEVSRADFIKLLKRVERLEREFDLHVYVHGLVRKEAADRWPDSR